MESVLEENAVHRSAGNNGFSRERTFRKIGSIPMIMLDDAFRQGINPMDGSPEGQKWVMKLLADNPKLRTVDYLKTQRKHILK